MRRLYIVTYDVSHPKRLRRVFRTLKGYGQHLQLSVFRCDLSGRQRLELEAKLDHIINHDEDQVMLVDLGPSQGRSHAIAWIGRPAAPSEERGAKIF